MTPKHARFEKTSDSADCSAYGRIGTGVTNPSLHVLNSFMRLRYSYMQTRQNRGPPLKKKLPFKTPKTCRKALKRSGGGNFGVGVSSLALECLSSVFPFTNGCRNSLSVRIFQIVSIFSPALSFCLAKIMSGSISTKSATRVRLARWYIKKVREWGEKTLSANNFIFCAYQLFKRLFWDSQNIPKKDS